MTTFSMQSSTLLVIWGVVYYFDSHLQLEMSLSGVSRVYILMQQSRNNNTLSFILYMSMIHKWTLFEGPMGGIEVIVQVLVILIRTFYNYILQGRKRRGKGTCLHQTQERKKEKSL